MFPRGGVPWNKGMRTLTMKRCKFCNKEFVCNSYQKHNIYCSLSCSSKNKVTEKFRLAISKRMRENNPVRKLETRQKISATLKEKYSKGEIKNPMTFFKENYPEKYNNLCRRASERMKNNNPMKRPEIANNVGLKNKGKINANIGKHMWENRKHPMLGKHHTEESKEKNRLSHLGRTWSDERKIKFSNYRKEIMKDPKRKAKFIETTLKGLIKKPTNLEQKFIGFCSKYELPFKYVGNGDLIIGFKNLDFIDGKNIIEIFSWHHTENNRNRLWHQSESGCKGYYNKYGYNTLILWDKDFHGHKWEKNILNKVNKFMGE